MSSDISRGWVLNRFLKIGSRILSIALLFLSTLASGLSWLWTPYSEYGWMGYEGEDRIVSNNDLWLLQGLSNGVLIALTLACLVCFCIKENRRRWFATAFLGIVFLVATSSIARLVVLSFVPERT